ncbi:MAG TPA: hypothetical protein VI078_16160 [bacterium]
MAPYLTLGLLLPLLAGPAAAATGRQVTPWAGYVSGGSLLERATGDVLRIGSAAGFGVVLDLPAWTGASYEVVYGFQKTELSGDDASGRNLRRGLDIHYVHVGGLTEFGEGTVRPFLVGGLGLTALVPDGRGSSSNFSLSLGGGVKVPLSDRVELRLEGRGYLTFIADSGGIFCVSSGASGGCTAGGEGRTLGQLAVLAGLSFRP